MEGGIFCPEDEADKQGVEPSLKKPQNEVVLITSLCNITETLSQTSLALLMKNSKAYNEKHIPNQFLNKVKDKNSEIIKQVLANNSYLLKKNNLTQKFQIEQLRIQGIKISRSGISRYRRGIYKTCALTYLHIFAEFWSVHLTTMMIIDLERED